MYDFINYKFGDLDVIGYSNKDICICKCSCKKLILVTEKKLLSGRIKSCGHKKNKKTEKDRLMRIYYNMKSRCYDKKNPTYKYYGKKGIKIYKRWLDKEKGFERFYIWAIENGYKDNFSIDRINNKKNYTPKNCRWTDILTQNNNKSNCRYIIYNNTKLTIAQWCRKLKISRYEFLKKIKEKGEQETIKNFLEKL